jgi:hypothetical protein
MEPRKQDLEQTPNLRPEEKKRRFRIIKLEEQRFRMDKLEDRIAPKSHASHSTSLSISMISISTDTSGRSSIE